jgi:hypothetical protein
VGRRWALLCGLVGWVFAAKIHPSLLATARELELPALPEPRTVLLLGLSFLALRCLGKLMVHD